MPLLSLLWLLLLVFSPSHQSCCCIWCWPVGSLDGAYCLLAFDCIIQGNRPILSMSARPWAIHYIRDAHRLMLRIGRLISLDPNRYVHFVSRWTRSLMVESDSPIRRLQSAGSNPPGPIRRIQSVSLFRFCQPLTVISNGVGIEFLVAQLARWSLDRIVMFGGGGGRKEKKKWNEILKIIPKKFELFGGWFGYFSDGFGWVSDVGFRHLVAS